MTNPLHDMATITLQPNGVEVRFDGPITKIQMEEMVATCSAPGATCCGPEFFAKVRGIEVGGRDGEVRVRIEGDVTPAEIEHNLIHCECRP